MGGHFRQLFRRFLCHGGVALHDPFGHLLIAAPGGILHQHPVVFLGALVDIIYGIIVIPLGDRNLCLPRIPDGLGPSGRGSLWHEHLCRTAQQSRRPGNTLAMVAVGGRGKDHLMEGYLILRLFQLRKCDLLWLQSQQLSRRLGHRINAAQALERIESKPR